MADNNKAAIWAAIIGALGVVFAALVSAGVFKTVLGKPDRTPPPATVSMGPLQGNFEYLGGDFSGQGIEANGAGQCSDYCLREPRCKAMTFVQHPNGEGGKCWLKSLIPTGRENQSMVSAVKVYP